MIKINLVIRSIVLFTTCSMSGCIGVNNCSNYIEIYRTMDKPIHVHSVLVAKYRDSTYGARQQPMLLFQDGSVYPINVYSVWENINPGDSLIKDSNSLKFYVIEKGQKLRTTYYAQCNGVSIE